MTVCRDCSREWTGMKECRCAACHEHFTSESVFSRHQVGGKCLTPDEMLAARTERTQNPVFDTTERVHGPTWKTWSADDRWTS